MEAQCFQLILCLYFGFPGMVRGFPLLKRPEISSLIHLTKTKMELLLSIMKIVENLEGFFREQAPKGHMLLFTGTFDPPHLGHHNCVLKALQADTAAPLCIVVNSWHPNKVPVATWQQRVEMLGRFLSDRVDQPQLQRINLSRDPCLVSDRERFDSLLAHYSVRVTRVMGSDRVDLITGGRDQLVISRSEVPISSTELRAAARTSSSWVDTTQLVEQTDPSFVELYR